MSTYYSVHTEAKINDKWVCIDGLTPCFKYDYKNHKFEDDYEYRLCDTYWNGSRSYFGETYDKLVELGRYISLSDLSDELKEKYHSLLEAEENGETVYLDLISVNFEAIKQYADYDKYDHHTVVHKDLIFAYENGDTEDLWPDEDIKLSDMTEEERKQYQYYEWDDSMGWNWGLKEIRRRAESVINRFKSANNIFDFNDKEYRVIITRD